MSHQIWLQAKRRRKKTHQRSENDRMGAALLALLNDWRDRAPATWLYPPPPSPAQPPPSPAE